MGGRSLAFAFDRELYRPAAPNGQSGVYVDVFSCRCHQMIYYYDTTYIAYVTLILLF